MRNENDEGNRKPGDRSLVSAKLRFERASVLYLPERALHRNYRSLVYIRHNYDYRMIIISLLLLCHANNRDFIRVRIFWEVIILSLRCLVANQESIVRIPTRKKVLNRTGLVSDFLQLQIQRST